MSPNQPTTPEAPPVPPSEPPAASPSVPPPDAPPAAPPCGPDLGFTPPPQPASPAHLPDVQADEPPDTRWVWGVWLLFGIVALATVGLLVWSHLNYAQAVQTQAQIRLQETAGGLAEHVDSRLHRIDLAIQRLRRTWVAQPEQFAAEVLESQALLPDQLVQVAVIDADGLLAFSNLAKPDPAKPRVNLADREHFKVHQSSGADALYISRPLLGRVSGKWTLQITRPILERGRFAGVLVVSADPESLVSDFFTAEPQPNMARAVLRSSGELLARLPLLEGRRDLVVRNEPMLLPDAPLSGSFRSVVQTDHTERWVGYRFLPRRGLVVATSLPLSVIEVPVRESAVRSGLVGVGLLSLYACLGVWAAYLIRQAQLAHLRLASIMRHSPLGLVTWDYEPITASLTLAGHNPAALQVSGRELNKLLGQPIESLFEADPLNPLPERLRQVGQTRQSWTDTVRAPLPKPDGSPRHLLMHAFFVPPSQVAVYVSDVSAQEQARVEQELAASVYRYSSEAMMITDASNCIVAINPAFTRLTGYVASDVLGHKPSVLSSGRHDAQFYQTMWAKLCEDGQWTGEIWNRRSNGEVYAEWLSISLVRGPDGQVHHHVGLFSDITERKQAEQAVWQQANFDAITGLPNRRLYTERLAHELVRSARQQRMLAVLFLDLDHFKAVNDTWGHDAGDRLLLAAAQRMQQVVREMDTVARIGGDEFCLLLPDLGQPRQADRAARALVRVLSTPFDLGPGQLATVSASVGVVCFPQDGLSADDLMTRADVAMYRAKRAGRGCFMRFSPLEYDVLDTDVGQID